MPNSNRSVLACVRPCDDHFTLPHWCPAEAQQPAKPIHTVTVKFSEQHVAVPQGAAWPPPQPG